MRICIQHVDIFAYRLFIGQKESRIFVALSRNQIALHMEHNAWYTKEWPVLYCYSIVLLNNEYIYAMSCFLNNIHRMVINLLEIIQKYMFLSYQRKGEVEIVKYNSPKNIQCFIIDILRKEMLNYTVMD